MQHSSTMKREEGKCYGFKLLTIILQHSYKVALLLLYYWYQYVVLSNSIATGSSMILIVYVVAREPLRDVKYVLW